MFKKIIIMAAATHAVLAKSFYMDLKYDTTNDLYYVNGVIGT